MCLSAFLNPSINNDTTWVGSQKDLLNFKYLISGSKLVYSSETLQLPGKSIFDTYNDPTKL